MSACCRDSPQPSDRRSVAGKNGTHFAHHSSRTAHRVSLPRECFAIDQFQSSGGLGWEASLLVSDEREYNIRFRGKDLLHLPTSPQSLAFSRIFTSHFLREATFFGVLISSILCKSAPAKKKKLKQLFMSMGGKVHSSLTTFILIAPLAILILQPHHFTTDSGQRLNIPAARKCV